MFLHRSFWPVTKMLARNIPVIFQPPSQSMRIDSLLSTKELQHNKNTRSSSSRWPILHIQVFVFTMSNYKKLEVRFEDHNAQKWCVPLKEDAFVTFMEKGNPTAQKVFGEGSLFSPWLFGKYFDPSDAFPLWEFESDALLSNLCSSKQRAVDWMQTDTDYVLKAELPEGGKNSCHVCVEDGKIVEISGRWRQEKESRTKDWRAGNWWELGYVRRIELPANADWRKTEACVNNDTFLEIRFPKNSLECDAA